MKMNRSEPVAADVTRTFHTFVAQISNLLYRRASSLRAAENEANSGPSTVCRLKIGDTAGWKPALRPLAIAGAAKRDEMSDVRKLASQKNQSLVTSAPAKQFWTRRHFLRDGARYGFLAALAAMMARVTTRKLSPGSQKCVNDGLCRVCEKVSGCGLPQALSFRSFFKGGKS